MIARNLSEEEIMGMKEMFRSIDTDNSGTITFEELKAGLQRLSKKISESEVKQIMEAVCIVVFKIQKLSFSVVFFQFPAFFCPICRLVGFHFDSG